MTFVYATAQAPLIELKSHIELMRQICHYFSNDCFEFQSRALGMYEDLHISNLISDGRKVKKNLFANNLPLRNFRYLLGPRSLVVEDKTVEGVLFGYQLTKDADQNVRVELDYYPCRLPLSCRVTFTGTSDKSELDFLQKYPEFTADNAHSYTNPFLELEGYR